MKRTPDSHVVRAVELTGTGVWELDADGRSTYVTESITDLLGYSHAEMIGRPIQDFLDSNGRIATEWALTRRRRGFSDVREVCVRRKDGEACWVLVSAAPLRGPDGEYQGTVACIVDVTRRKRVERRAVEQPAVQEEALRGAPGGRWEWNLTQDAVRWSPEVYEICCIDPKTFKPTFEGFLDLIHPQDRPLIRSAIDAALLDGKIFSSYFRIVRPDGGARVVYSRGKVGRNGSGELSLAGTIHDVTDPPTDEPTLTPRERSVLDLLAQGLTMSEVGGRLHLASGTVRTHVQNAIEKLGAHNRVHAVVLAIRAGELTP
jgi:PAS domain S-box-containing protein